MTDKERWLPGEATETAPTARWVSQARLAERDRLEAAIEQAERRLAGLEAEVAAALAGAWSAGLADARSAVAVLTDELIHSREAAREAAADAAIAAARALIGASATASREVALRLVDAALATASRPQRVLVSPALARVLGGLVSGGVPVTADARLEDGDVMVELASGKVESRLSLILAHLRPDILAHIAELP